MLSATHMGAPLDLFQKVVQINVLNATTTTSVPNAATTNVPQSRCLMAPRTLALTSLGTPGTMLKWAGTQEVTAGGVAEFRFHVVGTTAGARVVLHVAQKRD